MTGPTSPTRWRSEMDAPDQREHSLVSPVATGLVLAALVIAPLAAWFHSRAKQERIDRQTEDRLR